MSGKIQITHIFKHVGRHFIFSGKVIEGQILDNGWSVTKEGKIQEIRDILARSVRHPIAQEQQECMFVCDCSYRQYELGDVIQVFMAR